MKHQICISPTEIAGPCFYEQDGGGNIFHTFASYNNDSKCSCGEFTLVELQEKSNEVYMMQHQMERLKQETYRPVEVFTPEERATFGVLLNKFARMVYNNSLKHGFYEEIEEIRRHVPENLQEQFKTLVISQRIALQHSELSEALEASRKDYYQRDQHCPEFYNLEIEFCDLLIRVLDAMVYFNLRIDEPLFAKHEFNVNRIYKHGKKF